MGFDNECILNIQSLPGEYFCPVCRTLVYPNEALQTQCTHLYCKPCLAYIVATTCACPYDGYLVSEADAKPLIELNKLTAEAIEKIQVHCLYQRSGCQWQGTLLECITHCIACNFGNSPVVCNRCGTQIIHRQVQEHAQICPGVQPQAQQVDSTQTQASAAQNQNVASSAASGLQGPTTQAATSASGAAAASSTSVTAAATPAPAAIAAVPASSGQDQAQPSVAVQPQVAMQAPTTEQWYQQQQMQYQQYYQQYPGYDPYQQHYQHYGYYQQQVHPQYPQAYVQSHPVQGQQQPQVYVQQQPQAQPQAHTQPLPQPQVQTHPQPQAVPQGQLPQLQAPTNLQQPPHTHTQPQMQPSTQTQVPGQPLGQQPAQTPQLQSQPLPQAQPSHLQPQVRPQHQQPIVAQHPPPQLQQQQPNAQYQPQLNLHTHTQPPVQQPPFHMQPQPHPRPHSQPQPQVQPQPQLQAQAQPQPLNQPLPQPHLQPHPHGQPQPQPQPQPQLHPTAALAVTGHQSFPQSHLHQQTIPGIAAHQRPMHMHPLQQGVSQQQLQQSAPMQNQFPHQQPPQTQMRPPPSQMPVQAQRQATMPLMQGLPVHLPPGHQQAHHLVHPSAPQIHHQPSMQAPPQHPSIQQQQTQALPHHGQLHQQGSFPPQQLMHSQQTLRPQGPPYMQQSPQLQPVSQTMPRPVALNHTLPHQQFAQSPSGPSGIRSQLSSEKVGSGQFMQTGSQSSALPSSPTSLKPATDERDGDHLSDKSGYAPAEIGAEKAGDIASDSRKQKSENNLKYEADEEKLADKAEKENVYSVADGEGSAPLENDEVKVITKGEASGMSEQSPSRALADSSVDRNKDQGDTAQKTKEIERKSDGCDDKSVHGQAQGVDSTDKVHHGATSNVEPPGALEKAQGMVPVNERGNMQGPPRQPAHLTAPPAHDLGAPPPHERAFQPGIPDRNMPQFPNQGHVPGDPRGFPPPAQMQPKVLGPPTHHPPMHDHETYTQQFPPQGPQFLQSQRPPAPDPMLVQHMPPLGPNQERMLQELPPRGIQAHGQPFPPNQMRPPSHNFPENVAHPGQPAVMPDPFQASMLKHPPGGFSGPGSHTSVGRGPASFGLPQGSQIPGQGQMLPPPNAGSVGSRISQMEPFAGVPMGGQHTGSFDAALAMNARGPPAVEGQLARSHPHNPLEGDVYANRIPGPYDGRPDHNQSMPSENFPHGMQPGNQSNMMTMNGFPGKVPDSSLSHGSMGERFKPLQEERYKSLVEEGFKPPVEDRFRPYGLDPGRRIVDRRDFEEDLKQFPRPSDLDAEAGLKFEKYLSSSRPPLDRSSHALGFDAAARPFDRTMPRFGTEGAPRIGVVSPVSSRFMPVNQLGSHAMDGMERQRHLSLHDDHLGRKSDPPRPDFASEFGRHRMDSLHSLRSPGRELTGLSSSRFGSISIGHGLGSQTHLEEFNSRDPQALSERSKQHNLPPDSVGSALHENKIPILPISSGSGMLPGHFRQGEVDILRTGEQLGSSNLPGHMRSGDLDGRDGLPSHMRSGDPFGPGGFRNHLRLGERAGLENVPPHLRSRDYSRFGEPGFSSSFPMHGFPNEPGVFGSGSFQAGLDPLDHLRKRKSDNTGWCRLCKIDCETAEGLDLHSQTMEHQKMSMDIVRTIKLDNAKKQKLSSEEREEATKSRKAGFEGRASRR